MKPVKEDPKNAKNCFNSMCQKSFSFFFPNKINCDVCGKVFCKNCIEYKNGILIFFFFKNFIKLFFLFINQKKNFYQKIINHTNFPDSRTKYALIVLKIKSISNDQKYIIKNFKKKEICKI